MSKRPGNETEARLAALLKLADEHAAAALAATREQVVEDAAASGLDLRANSARMLEILDGAELQIGRAAMDAARAAMQRRSARGASSSTFGRRLATAASDARSLTLAARNGTAQSDRDKVTVQEDLDEIDAIIANEAGDS